MSKWLKKTILLALALATSLSVSSIAGNSVHAADASKFNAGNIIDDVVFYNDSSLSSSQIQTFLNSKNPNCDTDGTQPASDWGRPDITHAQLASYKRNGTNGYTQDSGFHAPPYVCLKDYTQNVPQMEAASGLCEALSAKSNQSSAQIIKDIATACGINPQVLIVLLQKEQSLVTDSWPLTRQYRSATGFDCPDTAPCDPAFAGFFYQVYYAARQFKVYQKYPNDYNYIAGRTNRIYWHPDLSRCGSSQVYIDNQATAALYIYTPYRPNQAALNNLYGTGDSCSSYGNRNFWRLFTDWFGSTTKPHEVAISARYDALGDSARAALGAAVNSIRCNLRSNGCYQKYANGAIIWTPYTGAWESYGPTRDRWGEMGYEAGKLGYPTSELRCSLVRSGCYQRYENGAILWQNSTGAWESTGSIRRYWATIGYENGNLGYPTGPERPLSGGGWYQRYENGYIIGKKAIGYWESMGPIRERWASLGYQEGQMGYPTSQIFCTIKDDGCYQRYENGAILWAEPIGAWESTGSIRRYWATTGYENGPLGYPVAAEKRTSDGGWYQQYEEGYIIGKRSTGYWESMGPIRERWASLGYQDGSLGYPRSPIIKMNSSTTYQQYERNRIYLQAPSTTWVAP